MKKNIILFTLFFISGFLTHAFFFPDFLANGLTDVSKIVIPNPTPVEEGGKKTPLITKIYFDGEKFSRHSVTIEYTRYLQIINNSTDTLMWLQSNHPKLSTTRGYGESEAVEAQFNERGQFIVADKNNPQERLVITVK